MTEIGAHHGPFKDLTLYVDDTGGPDRRPVLLVHGWPLSGEARKNQAPHSRGRGTGWSPTIAEGLAEGMRR
jgi:pimeloyl-ACP methyl ester carboxylesterase